MCTETGTVGRCARTLSGGVLVVTLTAGTAVAFRTLGGVNLVREVGESARGFRPAATLSTRPASPTNTGIPDCDAYIALVTRYMQCDKIPQGARDAAKQGLDQMQAGWQQLKDPSMPAEARQAAANACKQATDALRQGASAMGCPL
jgi:hypothetical protein